MHRTPRVFEKLPCQVVGRNPALACRSYLTPSRPISKPFYGGWLKPTEPCDVASSKAWWFCKLWTYRKQVLERMWRGKKPRWWWFNDVSSFMGFSFTCRAISRWVCQHVHGLIVPSDLIAFCHSWGANYKEAWNRLNRMGTGRGAQCRNGWLGWFTDLAQVVLRW